MKNQKILICMFQQGGCSEAGIYLEMARQGEAFEVQLKRRFGK